MSMLSALCVLCVCLLTAHGQGITFSLRGVTYDLNDIVTLDDLGQDSNGLIASTTHTPCCDSGGLGDWFLPGVSMALGTDSDLTFYQSRTENGEVVLNRGGNIVSTTGLYRCNIPDSSGSLVNVYIGVFTTTGGSPTVDSVTYDIASRTLTCMSSGGPATDVIWRKNCSPLTIDGSDYTQTQTVTDEMSASYTTTLTIAPSVSDIDGVYSCTVINRRGRSSDTTAVGNAYTPNLPVRVTLTPDSATPTAGQPLTMTCSHTTRGGIPTTPVTYQWLNSAGTVIGNTTTLTFTTLRESDRELYCLVTVDQLVGCAEHYIDVQVSDFEVSVTDGTGTVGSSTSLSITLTCSVSSIGSGQTTYTFYKGDSLLRGPTSSPDYTIITADLSVAGEDYYCEAAITLDYLDVSSPLTVRSMANGTVTLTIMTPQVLPTIVDAPSPLYTGLPVVIQCLVAPAVGRITGVTADIKLMNGDAVVTADDRITVGDVIQLSPGFLYQREYTISPLSKIADEDAYHCVGTLLPADSTLQQYITNGVASQSGRVLNTIVDPTLNVMVSTVTGRILDIAPYNSFQLDCTATSRVQSSATALAKTIEWMVSINGGSSSSVSEGIMSANLNMATSSSSLSVSTVQAGQYSYSCEAALELDFISDDIRDSMSQSVTVYGPSSPIPPTNLLVIRVDHETATLQWRVPSVMYDNETYVVMFGNDSSLQYTSSPVAGSVDITRTNNDYSVAVTGLQPRTMYYYRVQATNSFGPITSDRATFNTTGIGPSAPRSLTYNKNDPTSYTFTWLAPNDTDVTVAVYQLTCQAHLMDGTSLPFLMQSTTETTLSLTLTPWASYTCAVVALNIDSDSSPPSEEVIFNTQETAPSGVPQQVFVEQAPSRGSITFGWNLPINTQRNGVITNYSLRCVPTHGSEVVAMVFQPSPNDEYSIGGLPALTEYNCTVRAINSGGEGPPAVVMAMSGEDVPGAAPLNFASTPRLNSTVGFNWSPPPTDQHNGVLTNYFINCNDSQLTATIPAIELSVEISNFLLATRYTCLIRASTQPGQGPVATITFVTFPSAPTGLSVTPSSSSELTVSWSTSPGLVSRYRVYVNDSPVGYTNDVMYIVGELTPYTLYMVEVTAESEAGEGPRSGPEIARTLEDFPGIVSCTTRWNASSTSSVSVSWNPPQEENGLTLAYHLVLVRYGSQDPLSEANVTSTLRQYTLSGGFQLEDGVPYSVIVYAENSVGRGKEACLSTDFNVQLVPPTPTGVNVVRSDTGESMSVMWTVPTLVQAQGFVSYIVTFEPSSVSRKKRQMGSECTVSPCNIPVSEGGVTITGLNPGTSYSLIVTPANEDNMMGESTTTTSPGVAPPPMVPLAMIIGAAVGGLVIVVLIVVIIIVIVCCVKRGQKGNFRPDSPLPLDDIYNMESKERSEHSSSGTTSPRRVVSPLHMSVNDFLEHVPLVEFADYVEQMHQDRSKGFERAFDTLPKNVDSKCDIAKKNKLKNRFANIYPYDFSRVKLFPLPGEPDSDYINASYIDGYHKRDMYIAAQGPMPNTIGDFWRMIWEQGLRDVVMLTKCKENKKVKCEMYWPTSVGETYEPPSTTLAVFYKELTPFADYEIRKFFVTDTGDLDAPGLEVTHYLFVGWPDHGVPEYATALIGFIRRVRANYNHQGPPMLVHCSAGVGRTGTFITLDIMLERMQKQDTVNVYETLRDIRLKRALMVQTQKQYVFIHDALNELITCGETEIPAANIRMRMAGLHKIKPGGEHVSEFNNQFQLLNQVSPKKTECTEALQHYNQHKNRYQGKVPNTSSRVYLRPTGVNGAEYINASFIDGYKHRHAYIATQAPLATTVCDFWRMIWEFQSRAIVMLCDLKEDEQESSHLYWPTEIDTPQLFGKLQVTLVSEKPLDDGLVRRNFSISEDKEQMTSAGDKKFTVSQFHYTSWPEHDRPPSTDQVLKIVDEVNKVQRSTTNKPITVMCNDGMGRTGAFICIHAQLERIKTEGIVDLFQFVKSARIHRHGLIAELEHYIFCHDTLADFLDAFGDYSNFK